MQSEIDSLRQRISELEAEKIKLEAKNAEHLKQVVEENTKCEVENVGLKARIEELEKNKMNNINLKAENYELKTRVTKLERKQIQVITNEQEASTKDISLLIESQLEGEEAITSDPIPEMEHSSTQSESLAKPKTSATSPPQDIIDEDSAETLDFVKTVYNETVSKE
ncbi:4037_t:CDS:1 [Cetraspora pellucida]|uniref:4037_t:CDS:1 n=1 Tax=Cetraspora pellucida TaxID=1433469 RepID=A0A9N9FVB3_9GLOM|nr:4037_t:CDS:1 [Cetraspora pellucida]